MTISWPFVNDRFNVHAFLLHRALLPPEVILIILINRDKTVVEYSILFCIKTTWLVTLSVLVSVRRQMYWFYNDVFFSGVTFLVIEVFRSFHTIALKMCNWPKMVPTLFEAFFLKICLCFELWSKINNGGVSESATYYLTFSHIIGMGKTYGKNRNWFWQILSEIENIEILELVGIQNYCFIKHSVFSLEFWNSHTI